MIVADFVMFVDVFGYLLSIHPDFFTHTLAECTDIAALIQVRFKDPINAISQLLRINADFFFNLRAEYGGVFRIGQIGIGYSCAYDTLKDAMDLEYLTGQRQNDVLKMTMHDIRDGALEVRQNKTEKKLRIILEEAELGAVIKLHHKAILNLQKGF